jgi:SAM-dependent methyltransferase
MTNAREVTGFAFGKNWKRFIKKHLSEERILIAQRHLLDFLGRDDLSGVRMIDIGCGSGIHSLAALRSNVATVLSFDYDPDSVAAARQLHEMSGSPAHWRVEQGSVLDKRYLDCLGQFDLVYAWGVLHHTSDQWTAFRNAVALIAPGGVFYVALYTSGVCLPSDEFWLDVKRRYNRSGWFGRRKIEIWYILRDLNYVRSSGVGIRQWVRNYMHQGMRGMEYYTNARDWVGGWPMEFSKIEEVKSFACHLGLKLINIETGELNTEYLFRRPEGTFATRIYASTLLHSWDESPAN